MVDPEASVHWGRVRGAHGSNETVYGENLIRGFMIAESLYLNLRPRNYAESTYRVRAKTVNHHVDLAEHRYPIVCTKIATGMAIS